MIPYSHAQTLEREVEQAVLHSLGCGHNDCPRSWSLIREFLTDAGIQPDPAGRGAARDGSSP